MRDVKYAGAAPSPRWMDRNRREGLSCTDAILACGSPALGANACGLRVVFRGEGAAPTEGTDPTEESAT